MRVDVLFSPTQIDEGHLKDQLVVIVDVLRASTTIATALNGGARDIVPVASVDAAIKISSNLFAGVFLLAGERGGKLIDGFDLSNSPAEFTPARVSGKTIILTTTNGTAALVRGRLARQLIVGGIINAGKIVEHIATAEIEHVLIVCAGHERSFSQEDAVCAGLLVDGLSRHRPVTLADGARAAQRLYEATGGDLLGALRESDHGRALIELGYEADLGICAALDTIPVVPIFDGSVLKLRRDVAAKFKKVDLVSPGAPIPTGRPSAAAAGSAAELGA